jgi:hypothetical protein
MEKIPITVAELIALLQAVDPVLPVRLEGCDCTGDCVGVDEVNGHRKYVLLRVEG